MSRQIQIGDRAIIRLGQQIHELNIVGFDIGQVYILSPQNRLSRLILTGEQWVVDGLDIPHSVEFQTIRRGLANIKEIDQLILLHLDYSDLKNVFQLSRYFKKICRKKLFWIQKITRDFTAEVLAYKGQFERYQAQYCRLNNAKSRSKHAAAASGRIDELIILKGKSDPSSHNKLGFTTPIPPAVYDAIENGRLEAVKWLIGQGQVVEQYMVDRAVERGHVNVLSYLSDLGFRPSSRARSCHLDVLKWMLDMGFQPEYDLSFVTIVEERKIETLDWLYQRGIVPHSGYAHMAARYGFMDVFKWMYDHGIYPDKKTLPRHTKIALTQNGFIW